MEHWTKMSYVTTYVLELLDVTFLRKYRKILKTINSEHLWVSQTNIIIVWLKK